MRKLSNEMRDFLIDLQVFAGCWVEDVQNVILEHIDELFADEAIRFLVKQYAEETNKNAERNKKAILDAYEYEHNKVFIWKNALYNHRDALYQLCYKRYVDEKNTEKEEVTA